MKAKLTIFKSQIPRQVRLQSRSGRRKIARQIADEARAAAPYLTGVYASGIEVKESGTQIMVVDNDETAIHKEYGTSKTPAHASLTNAAMHYGKYSGMRPKRGRKR
ncbi:hypothetical protein FRC0360_00157 [Corynebacterium diphtheriae]|nr:hypothetical protein FRC0360_00157 [Corynebacterium diphtheriae]